ncbi:MAG TPA: DNA-binding transcriptional regulator [Opitutaceae bacterium]|jgi:LacI family transcriptional regulator
MAPELLLVFQTRYEECTSMLKGIAHFHRLHSPRRLFLDDQARSEADTKWLRSRKWDGAISRHTTPALVRACAEMGVPLVDLNDSEPFDGVPKIRPDNVGIGHMGAEHFIERGYSHFAFCGFSNAGWAQERRDGFVEGLQLAGRTCEIFEVSYPGDLNPYWDAEQTTALVAWLEALPKPIGVMACNDLRALQIMAATHSAGLVVPDDVAVLGVNNETIRCELSNPPLSSVAPNAFRSGYEAAQLLEELLQGNRPKTLVRRIDALGVVLRHSTDVLAIQDRPTASALGYIRDHAHKGITVADVMKHAFASRSQLEKKFRRHIGRSPQAEIRRVQVAKIRQLLAETDFPLKRIAELTGFEYIEYMSVVFKRLVGESPGAYRQKVQRRFKD